MILQIENLEKEILNILYCSLNILLIFVWTLSTH